MNRKALSLLIAVAMVLAVVPVGLATGVSANVTALNPLKEQAPSVSATEIPGFHKTGMLWVSPEEYAKVTGIHFKPMTAKAFQEAIKNAPFYPGRSKPLASASAASASELPARVFNGMYLPPIGDQGWVGSCTAWSSTYYVWTYMINWWRNNPFPHTDNDIMNPLFTYNLINGGRPHGTSPWDAMNVISTIGAVPLNRFVFYNYPPKDIQNNETAVDEWLSTMAAIWPNFTDWMTAPYNSGTWDM